MGVSLAQQFADLDTADQAAMLAGLSDDEAQALLADWEFWARPEQLEPPGEWFVWLILAGRGFGKTRSGAEWAKAKALAQPKQRIALVAETFADGRDTMVEGESGLLSVLPEHALRGGNREEAWNRSLGELFLANGSYFKVASSEKPDGLRGPQWHWAWGDEPAKWKDAHKGMWAEDTTWSNLLFGLRLGSRPRICLTGTPKRVKLLVGDRNKPGLLGDKRVVITRGRTDDNLGNLADSFRQNVIEPLRGTRLGRQEVGGEVLEDVEGALWTSGMIEADRAEEVPDELARIVVSIDPAVTSKADSDETGIVLAGTADIDGVTHGFVFGDLSCRESSQTWASRAVVAYKEWMADVVVGEVNNGGDLVERVVRLEDPAVNFRQVRASRGKALRAEPIQALYERHLIHHVGNLADLEDQMTSWVPSEPGDSPDRLDALVWALTELFVDSPGVPNVW